MIKYFLILISLKLLKAQIFDQQVNPGHDGIEKPPILYKCSNGLKNKFYVLPQGLQIPLMSHDLSYYKNNLLDRPLFNFTLELNPKSNCREQIPFKIFNHFDSSEKVKFNFTPMGYLGIYEKNDAIYFHPENFCIKKITPHYTYAQVCKSQCTTLSEMGKGEGLCIKKCCPPGKVMIKDSMTLECSDVSTLDLSQKRPLVYSHSSLVSPLLPIWPQFNIHNVQDGCRKRHVIDHVFRNSELRILANGEIVQKQENKWRAQTKNKDFCIDHLWNETSAKSLQISSDVMILICESRQRQFTWRELTHGKILFVIVLTATLINLIVLTLYGSLRRKLTGYGWTVVLFFGSNLLVNLSQSIFYGIYFWPQSLSRLYDDLSSFCVSLGIIHHFFLISAISWTTALHLNDSHLFYNKNLQSTKMKKKNCVKGLCLGLVIPTVVVYVTFLMEFLIGIKDNHVIKPHYKLTCLVHTPKSFVLYMASILGLILIFNCLTTLRTYMKSRTKPLAAEGGNLQLKLLLLTGFFILCEITLTVTAPLTNWSIYFSLLHVYKIIHAGGLSCIFIRNGPTWVQLCLKYPILNFLQKSSDPIDIFRNKLPSI